jgi:hypothetical protein
MGGKASLTKFPGLDSPLMRIDFRKTLHLIIVRAFFDDLMGRSEIDAILR